MLLGFIIMGLLPCALISLAIYGLIYLARRNRTGKQSFLRHFVCYLLLVYLTSLLYLTIFWGGFDFDFSNHFLNLRPFIWLTETYEMGYARMIKQLLTNIAMFMPYGLLLPLVCRSCRKWGKTVLVVLGSSAAIEAVQYFIGRSCDVDDLIMNFSGGCLGYGVFKLLDLLGQRWQWYQKMTGATSPELLKADQ